MMNFSPLALSIRHLYKVYCNPRIFRFLLAWYLDCVHVCKLIYQCNRYLPTMSLVSELGGNARNKLLRILWTDRQQSPARAHRNSIWPDCWIRHSEAWSLSLILGVGIRTWLAWLQHSPGWILMRRGTGGRATLSGAETLRVSMSAWWTSEHRRRVRFSPSRFLLVGWARRRHQSHLLKMQVKVRMAGWWVFNQWEIFVGQLGSPPHVNVRHCWFPPVSLRV